MDRLILFTALCVVAVVNGASVTSFGIKTANARRSAFTIRLYWLDSVYSCLVNPTEIGESYYCDANNIRVDSRCNDTLGEYVFEIENPYEEEYMILLVDTLYVNSHIFNYSFDSDYAYSHGPEDYIYIDHSDIVFVSLDITNITAVAIQNVVLDEGAGDGIASAAISVDVARAKNGENDNSYTPLPIDVLVGGYVHKCRLYFPYTDDDDLDPESCSMTDWMRYRCDEHETEARTFVTLRNPDTYGIEVTQIKISGISNEDIVMSHFCIITESTNLIPLSPDERGQCEAAHDVGIDAADMAEYGSIEMDANNNAPIAVVMYDESWPMYDGVNQEEGMAIKGLSMYELCLTTCDGDAATNDEKGLDIILKGTKGSTYMNQFGNDGSGQFTLPSNGGETGCFPIGDADIGEFVSASFELINLGDGDTSSFCLAKFSLTNNENAKTTEYGAEWLGRGIFLAPNGLVDYDIEFHWLTGLRFIPLTQFAITVDVTKKQTNIELELHVCADASDEQWFGSSTEGLFVSVTGKGRDGEFVSSKPQSLLSHVDLEVHEHRIYHFSVPLDLEEIVVVQISNDNIDDMLCIDEVLINHQKAVLTNNFIGDPNAEHECGGHADHAAGCAKTASAILSLPVCAAAMFNERLKFEPTTGTAEEEVFISECTNNNRLFATECAASQTLEATHELSYDIENGGSVTTGLTISNSFSVESPLQFLVGGGNYDNTVTVSIGGEYHHSRTSTDASSNTHSHTCEGSASVPPMSTLSYSVTIQKATREATTINDIRYTLCSAALNTADDDMDDEDKYIWVYDVPAHVRETTTMDCKVDFQRSTYHPQKMNCDEAIERRALEFGTYMPLCQDNTALWEPCQCAYGDSLTQATCICVDEESGIPPEYNVTSEVVNGNASWEGWCDAHCPNSRYPPAYDAPKQSAVVSAAEYVQAMPIDEISSFKSMLDSSEMAMLMRAALAAVVCTCVCMICVLLMVIIEKVFRGYAWLCGGAAKTVQYHKVDEVDDALSCA